MVRFTIWISVQEREMLTRRAERHNSSVNYIVRTAVRAMLGLPIRQDILVTEETEVTNIKGDN